MKFVFFTLTTLLAFAGCSTVESHRLAVNVTYNGSEVISSSEEMITELYGDATDVKNANHSGSYVGPYYFTSVSGSIAGDLDKAIYYMLAYVDKDNSGTITTGDPYTIYNGKIKTGTPDPIDLTNNDVTIAISFDDTNTWP